ERLARQFEQTDRHLRAVAYRMLGSLSEADDAVQDTWLRLSRADTTDVENLHAWLTTAVGPGRAQHAPLAAHEARADPGRPRARPNRRPGRREQPGTRGDARRLGRAGPARRG